MGAKSKPRPLSGHVTASNNAIAFETFFVVKRVSTNNETFVNVSPFLVQNAVSATVGDVASIKRIRSGDLLIEVNSQKQAKQILKIKALADIKVTVEAHRTLNSSEGVISVGELFNVPVEEITNELKSQGVSHVRRILIRRDGQLLPTKHLILTFRSPKLPDYIKAGYINCPVRPYIPNLCVVSIASAMVIRNLVDAGHSLVPVVLKLVMTVLAVKHQKSALIVREITPRIPVLALLGNSKKMLFRSNLRNRCHILKPGALSKLGHRHLAPAMHRHLGDLLSVQAHTQRKKASKAQKSLAFKLAKRGLAHKDLAKKFSQHSRKSAALGIAQDGPVHKDLPSLFGGIPKNPDVISLHPSEENEDLKMSCELTTTPNLPVSNSFLPQIT
ncbi:hypothetical protein AVEN_264713-1 [Araneus ventricosus]|uniref:Uncharacterized protein n=1 Tax=Araneus ventricosus TaxID=182803 RepID=A0A4Y2MTY3_ARAVE|nr:hypothetical protein AVEN_264713-1 [Araneus ventricosus]